MSEGRFSLNPNANSFITKRKSDALKEMAAKYISELYEKKKTSGETTITKQEIANLVWHFVSIGYKELTDSEKLKIQSYLNMKLLSSSVPVVRPVSDLEKIGTKLNTKLPKPNNLELYDVSKFQARQVPFLLVSFWGLYRHEQAQRPLLSLTHRPDAVKDKIWSLDSSDKKLWNQSCVTKVCHCPPIFGYSVPSNFFGDLPHLHYTCPEQKIHLNHYLESSEGNEFILTHNWKHCVVDEQLLEDVNVNTKISVDVKGLKDQFETTVSGICSLLSKFSEESDSGIEDNEEDTVPNSYTSFWDDIDTKISHLPISRQSRDSLVDDGDHPLLQSFEICAKDEVSLEVKEMIRKSLSPKKEKTGNDMNRMTEEQDVICDPPCSVWCDSTKKKDNSEVIVHSKSTLDNFNDVPTIDLISFDKFDSKEKTEPINITLNPTQSFYDNKMKPKHPYHSVDGCNPFCSEKRFDFTGVTAHASNLTKPKNAVAFPKDPVDFFQFHNASRIISLEDTDSEFASQSWQENIFVGKCEHETKSTWELVSGEDSLWKPLPECVETNDRIPFLHKQVRNYRRQRSGS